jgi:YD repeat-containing protein
MYTFSDLLGATSHFTYEAVRHPRSLEFTLRISAITNAEGKTVRYEYDDTRQTMRVTLPDGQTFVAAQTPDQDLRATLDAKNGRLIHTAAGHSPVVTPNHHRSAVEPWSGALISCAYDERGNLVSAETAPGVLTTYSYNPLSHVEPPAGTVTSYSYDPENPEEPGSAS